MKHIENITFSEIFDILQKNIYKLSSLFIITGVLSFSALLIFVDDYYISNARLTVAEQIADQSPSNPISSLVADVGIGSSTSKGVEEFEEILKSRKLFLDIISDAFVYKNVIAASSFNKITNETSFDLSMINVESGELLPRYHREVYFAVAHKTFLDNLSFDNQLNSNYFSISYKHISPVFSKKMVELIIKKINESLRVEAILKSKNSISFLKEQIINEYNAEVRDSISRLIEVEIKKQMLSNISSEYLVEVIDPPLILLEKSGPSRGILSVIFSLFILFVITPIVIIKDYFKE